MIEIFNKLKEELKEYEVNLINHKIEIRKDGEISIVVYQKFNRIHIVKLDVDGYSSSATNDKIEEVIKYINSKY